MKTIDSIKAKYFGGKRVEITIELENEGKYAEQFLVRFSSWVEDENGDVTAAGTDTEKEFGVSELGRAEAMEQAWKAFGEYKTLL